MSNDVQSRWNGAYPQIPQQKLSIKKKNDSWREANIDAIDGIATSMSWDGRSSKARKQVNYDLMNSKIDPQDYTYVMDPVGIGDKYGATPAKLRCMNVVRQKIEKLKGDEIERPFDFSIMAVNGGGVSDRAEKKMKVLHDTMKYLVRKEAGLTDEKEDSENFQSLEEAEASTNTYADVRERYASAIVKNGLEDQRLEFKFSEGFEHGLVVGEEIYYVGIVANEPVVRTVNPLYFEWEKGPETSSIQDAGWCREERFMSVSEIIDEFGDFLSEKQVKDLDEGTRNLGMNRNTMLPGYAYDKSTLNDYEQNSSYDARSRTSFIRVVTCVWKSMKKVGFHQFLDEDGQPQETMVDETFELAEEQIANGDTIEWQWINEVWKGTKLGDDVYLDINPMDNQMRTMDNPSECKLPYVGMTYNNMNSQTTSLLDLMKPHQYLYNIVWYRIEDEIAKAKGKKVVMDLAQLPTDYMNMEQWMYYFDNLGIMYINSFQEGKAGTRSQGMMPQFNQFTELDLTLSQTINQYMMILGKLEQLIDTISGIPRQAEGDINQYETATGIQQSLINSSAITQYYFYRHDEIKREVLRQYIETSKYAYLGGKKIHYITDDMERMVVELDGELFADSDYNVFPTNANKDKMLKMKIEQLAPAAMQQDKANLSDLVKLFKTNSMAEFEAQLIKGEQEKIMRDQQAQESQNQGIQMQIEAQKEKDAMDHERELDKINLKGEWDVRKAVTTGAGFAEDKDENDNGIPDIVEIGQMQTERAKASSEADYKDKQLNQESVEKSKDRQLEREKIASAERMNKENNKVALKNKVVGEK